MSKIALPSDLTPDVQSPALLAEKVFDAIRRRQFWILSHADAMRDTVINRAHQAVNQSNPDESSADELSSYLSCYRAGLSDATEAE